MKAIRKDQWLALAIVAVVVVTFALVGYLPQRRQLAALERERADAKSALSQDRASAAELPGLRQEINRMAEQLSLLNRRLPGQHELGEFFKEVSFCAQASGLTGASFDPKKEVTGEIYDHMPVNMKFTGTFGQLDRFLRKAKSMARLTHVRDLVIRNDTEMAGQCSIDLVMTIYFSRG